MESIIEWEPTKTKEMAERVKDIAGRVVGKAFSVRNNIGRTIKIREGRSHAKLTELANKYTNIEHNLKFALFWYADKTLSKYRRGIFKWSKTEKNEEEKNKILLEFETIIKQVNDEGLHASNTREKRNLQIKKIGEIFKNLYDTTQKEFGENTQYILREGLTSIEKRTILSRQGISYVNTHTQAHRNNLKSQVTRENATVTFGIMIILMGATLAIAIISSSAGAVIPAAFMALIIKLWIPKNKPEYYFKRNHKTPSTATRKNPIRNVLPPIPEKSNNNNNNNNNT
jgi:hypothetical protein